MIVEADRKKLDSLLSVKQRERSSRHLQRHSSFKKGCFNFALIKKQRKYFRNLRSRGSNPRYRRQLHKKVRCSRVILKKEVRATEQQRGSKKSKKRSLSTPVEPKLYAVDKVKIRIETRVQQTLDSLRGEKNVRLVRFSDVEKQFGEVIDRIKRLKFAVEPN